MKKLFTVLAATIVASNIFAGTSVYKKVTTTPADWTGTYLIVCEGQNTVFNGGADADNIDKKGGSAVIQNVTFSEDGTLAGTDALDAATFTISKTDNEDWPWAIQSKSGLYIGHKDEADNGLSAETELKNKCKHTLSINSKGNFVATPQYTAEGAGVEGNVYILRYNKADDQLRFRYYTSDDEKAVQIYRLENSSSINDVKANDSSVTVKQVVNGQVIIQKNGMRYNIQGMKY